MATTRTEIAPAEFLQLAGHPLRWRLLVELGRSDRQVRELTALVDQPQNLVSYHLGRLRDGRLVTMRRSSADGRDAYYAVDLSRCGDLLAAAGAAIHPGLRLRPPTPQLAKGSPRVRVLFLCSGNSARSQLAEAIVRQLTAGAVLTRSAGSHPRPLHPNAVKVMRSRGMDISDWRSKPLGRFVRLPFSYVVTLCDRVREVCPAFAGAPQAVHWSVPDPALAGETAAQSHPEFVRTADDIEVRSRFLLHRIAADRAAA